MKIAILAMMVISSLSFAATTPEVCQLAINGRVTGAMIYKTQGSGFFDQASQYAKQHGVCVKASLLWSNNGVRVYSANGARVGGKGGSEYSSLSQQANYSCVDFACIAVVDSKAQTGTGYGTGTVVRPGSRISTPATPAYVPPTYVEVSSGSAD
ncbi:MAG: hypothetical protein J0M15_02380 [Deltaproteobacteria bacterium]|nr:hypothetical protein [Deltaproteobacteria bacterium]